MKNRKVRRVIDYLVDTLVTNLVVMAIVIPYYVLLGMPWSGLKIIICAFLTIGWVQCFPIPIVLRQLRRKIPYLEVKG